VLELVFEQEQHVSCKAILQLARAHDIQLVLPAYSVVEASTVLRRQESKRNIILGKLHGELREVARMHGYGGRVEAARDSMSELLVQTVQGASDRFTQVTEQLLQSAVLLPLTAEEIGAVPDLQARYGLSYQDAIVFASVLRDPELGRMAACFLNKNTKDFDDPSIHELLDGNSCKLLGNFDSGYQYIQAKRAPAS
jgi:predicted nucleic acid-binding protein